MKRILTVLSRRAIHEQCLLARRLLQQQQKREALELQRHELERQLLMLQQKVRLQQRQQQQQQHDSSSASSSSLACLAWQHQMETVKSRHEEILLQLKPLRLGQLLSLSPVSSRLFLCLSLLLPVCAYLSVSPVSYYGSVCLHLSLVSP